MDKAYVRENTRKGKNNLIVSVLKGLLISAAIAVCAVFLFAAVAMKFDDPIKTTPIFGVCAMMTASFFGGLFSAKFYGERGAGVGALFGVIYILVVALISLVLRAEITTTAFAVLAPIAVLVSVLGGIVGAKGKKSKNKKKRKA